MGQRDHLLGLIQQLYAAPGTTDGWRVFLDDLRVTLHGSAANLISHNLVSHTGDGIVTTLADAQLAAAYRQYWGARDPWAHSSKQSQRRLSTSVRSINRNELRQPFLGKDVELLEALVPHVRRALQLHRRLVAAKAASEDFASVIDASHRGVFLIDESGRISFMNRAASELTSMRDGLAVERGELQASRAANTAHLRSVIARAIKTSNAHGRGPGGTFRLSRPSGRRPLVLLVSPGSQQQPLFPEVQSASAVVFVTDPDRVDLPDEVQVGALFGLTRAEAKLACLLAQGFSLWEAGNRLGVRRETVRSRVKTIFEKTNTHRQPDLVRVILNGTPRM